MANNQAHEAQDLSQDEWDRINQFAQTRRGRAQWLSLERSHGGEFSLPAPRPVKSAAERAELFMDAADILRRIGAASISRKNLPFAEPNAEASAQVMLDSVAEEERHERHLTLVEDHQKQWDESVDWSDCVEREDANEEPSLDLNESRVLQEFIELREREIGLRAGRFVFQDEQESRAMDQWRLETLAWKELGNSKQRS